MKGLLVKDLRLMLGQKQSMIILPVIAVILLFTNEDVSFVVGYMVLLGAIFCMATLSYDVFDNGMAYLMTLPVKRKTYVYEKYVFVIGAAAVLGVLTVLVGLLLNGTGTQDIWVNYFMMLAVAALMISVMLPIQLKFGPEKSRVVMIFMFAIIGAAVTVFSGAFGRNEDAQKIVDSIMNLPDRVMSILVPLAILLLVVISMLISVKIIENKEY